MTERAIPETEEKTEKTEKVERPERSASVELQTVHGPCLVRASTLNLKNAKGEDTASVFSVSYCAPDADPATRPVTFCFNGGPGSSAVWLQFGALGPLRVDLPDAVAARPSGNALVDNPEGLFDQSDLVFIDPVGTGFSRPAGETEAKAFHTVDDDQRSVGEFIWRWLSREGRWASPKYLAGESYGTTRAGALALHLQEKGVALEGLVLISLALNFQTFVEEAGNDLPYILYLPSLAAVAAYHGKVEAPDLEAVRRFALDRYAPALLRGAGLAAEERDALAEELASLTSLPAAEIARRNLRIPYLWFCRQLLGDGRNVGRLDARYIGHDPDRHGPILTADPSYDAPLGAYTVAANDFLRRRVGFTEEAPYEVLSMAVNEGWSWMHGKRLGYVNTTEDLRKAMVSNPHLRVFVGSGIYDLATPFFASEYTVDHLGVPAELRAQVVLHDYEAGHMMYFHPPSRAALRRDLVAFYEGGQA